MVGLHAGVQQFFVFYAGIGCQSMVALTLFVAIGAFGLPNHLAPHLTSCIHFQRRTCASLR